MLIGRRGSRLNDEHIVPSYVLLDPDVCLAIGKRADCRLSQRRADSVRTYLVSRGFPSEKISARGIGPDRPIAENKSAEGRANNRRVEIVIAKGPAGAK